MALVVFCSLLQQLIFGGNNYSNKKYCWLRPFQKEGNELEHEDLSAEDRQLLGLGHRLLCSDLLMSLVGYTSARILFFFTRR